MMGISQQKGSIHLRICEPLRADEIAECARLVKNERFAALAKVIDRRIHSSYKLHKTNYIAADLLNATAEHESHYGTSDMEKFIAYSEHTTLKGPSTAARNTVMDLFLRIYANPVFNSEKAQQ